MTLCVLLIAACTSWLKINKITDDVLCAIETSTTRRRKKNSEFFRKHKTDKVTKNVWLCKQGSHIAQNVDCVSLKMAKRKFSLTVNQHLYVKHTLVLARFFYSKWFITKTNTILSRNTWDHFFSLQFFATFNVARNYLAHVRSGLLKRAVID